MDLILDVDTGVDDALALLLAARCPRVRLLAVGCTGGNAPVDRVVVNTLTVLETGGAPDVPVARGAAAPLREPPAATPRGHGRDGMADLGLPPPARRPAPVHAVALLRSVLLAAAEPVTVVTLARLTNLAELLRRHPEVTRRIDRVVVMGGIGAAAGGAGLPPVEFNVASDPEAAAVVFGAGLPLLMYGLDVFGQVTLGAAEVSRLVTAADPGARLAGALLRHQQARGGGGLAGLGDAGAVAVAVRPELVRTEPATVRVQTAGPERGRTLLAPAGRLGRTGVAVGVDAAGCRELFLDAVGRDQ